MIRTLVASVLAAAVVVIAPGTLAQQRPRVSVGPFTGAEAGVVRDAVVLALDAHAGDIELVSAADYAAAARRLGVEGLSGDEDIARVGRELRLDAVVVGNISRRGRTLFLRLRVVRGRDGVTLGAASWELRRLNEAFDLRAEIWNQLRGYFQVDPMRVNESVTSQVGGAPVSASASVRSTEGATASSLDLPATSGLGMVYVTVAGGGAMRFWRIPVLGELSPRSYDNGGYPEARLEAMALYRWAHDRAGVGVSAAVAVPLALASQGIDAAGNTVNLESSALELWGGAAAAYRPPGGGWMRAHVGMVAHSFFVDTNVLPREQRLAPVSYTGLRLALDGMMPLLVSAGYELGVLFGTELRVTAVGSEVRRAFGENPSATLGLGGMAGLFMQMDGLLPGLAVRLWGEMLRYRTSFAGRSDIGPGSDSVDDYFRFHLGVVYAIGTRLVGRVRSSVTDGSQPRS